MQLLQSSQENFQKEKGQALPSTYVLRNLTPTPRERSQVENLTQKSQLVSCRAWM